MKLICLIIEELGWTARPIHFFHFHQSSLPNGKIDWEMKRNDGQRAQPLFKNLWFLMKAGGGASHSHSANSISFNQPNQFHSTLLMNWWLMKKWMKLNEGMSAVSPGWPTTINFTFLSINEWKVCCLWAGQPPFAKRNQSINQSIKSIKFSIWIDDWWLLMISLALTALREKHINLFISFTNWSVLLGRKALQFFLYFFELPILKEQFKKK